MPADVVCPTCNTVSHLDEVERDTGGFCSTCDYPLFWANRTTFAGPSTGVHNRRAATASGYRGVGHPAKDHVPRLRRAQLADPGFLRTLRGRPATEAAP